MRVHSGPASGFITGQLVFQITSQFCNQNATLSGGLTKVKYELFGETVDLAEKVQEKAIPGTVYASETTVSMLSPGVFRVTDIDATIVEGPVDPRDTLVVNPYTLQFPPAEERVYLYEHCASDIARRITKAFCLYGLAFTSMYIVSFALLATDDTDPNTYWIIPGSMSVASALAGL
ncbi:hypothetical protein HDU76_011455, partial [Blyttiomyces sp. JEL0837]